MIYRNILLLDLDGTLLDYRQRHFQCFKKCAEHLGGSFPAEEEYWEKKRSRKSLDDILKLYGMHDKKRIFLEYWSILIEDKNFLKLDQAFDGTEEALKMYSKIFSEVWLVTMRKRREGLDWQIDQLGWNSIFKRIIFNEAAYSTKADLLKSYIFEDSVMVGDTEEDRNAAVSKGIPFVGFTRGIRKAEFLDTPYHISALGELNSLISQIK